MKSIFLVLGFITVLGFEAMANPDLRTDIVVDTTAVLKPFNLEDYKKQCGGEYFPACNAVLIGSNQWSMFKHAAQYAKQEKKLVLVATGYSRCKSCVNNLLKFTSDKFNNPDVLKKINDTFVVVAIDKEKQGAPSVLLKLGIPKDGLYETVVYDPLADKVLMMVNYPQELGN